MHTRDSMTTRRHTADRPAGLLTPQPPWRRALRSLLSAAVRVHHYRDLHSRMLRDALDELDGGSDSPCP